MKKKPVIRALNSADLAAVKAVAKTIWEGSDYLLRIGHRWLKAGGMYGMELDGRLIGVVKLTLLPDQVIWLEGLRIHADYQSHGYGNVLSAFALETALGMRKQGLGNQIEFSTYHLNEESIHITTKAGFRRVEQLYIMAHDPVPAKPLPAGENLPEELLSLYPLSLIWGWKFLHPTQETLAWLRKKTKMYQVAGGRFYGGGEQPVVVLLDPPGKWLEEAQPYMQSLCGKHTGVEIVFPFSRKAWLPKLEKHGFRRWEPETEDIIQVFRYLPDQPL